MQVLWPTVLRTPGVSLDWPTCLEAKTTRGGHGRKSLRERHKEQLDHVFASGCAGAHTTTASVWQQR
ncbi:hypothetical protein WJX84_011498, partial [Apatococcus fuscideae]